MAKYKNGVEDPESLREAARLIDAGMTWSKTAQGHGFWMGVKAELNSLAIGAEAENDQEPTLENIGESVEVRDYGDDEWETITLYGVAPSTGDPGQYRFFGACEDGNSDYFKQARLIK